VSSELSERAGAEVATRCGCSPSCGASCVLPSTQGETSERILQSGTRLSLPFLQSNEEVISSGRKVLTKDLIKCLQMCVISKVFNSCNAKQFHTECAYKIPFNHCRALFYCSRRSIITLFFFFSNLQHHESWISMLSVSENPHSSKVLWTINNIYLTES